MAGLNRAVDGPLRAASGVPPILSPLPLAADSGQFTRKKAELKREGLIV